MAHFYAPRIKSKTIDETTIRWLELLPNHFHILTDIQGADFHCDFLVIKQDHVFNIEAMARSILSATTNSSWVQDDGHSLDNPFPQLLDQNEKVADYIIIQRDNVFVGPKANSLWAQRRRLIISPIVVLSKPSHSLVTSAHQWRRIFSDGTALRRHLTSFKWHSQLLRNFSFNDVDIKRLAKLLKAEPIDPSEINHRLAQVPSVVALRASLKWPIQPGNNPYQHTFTVTGEHFFGRERELLRIQQGLRSTPAVPISIIGLQRAGKSSLARETIRRVAGDGDVYRVIEFDFRRFQSEPRGPEHDITTDFIRSLATGAAPDADITPLYERASHSSHMDQQRLFIEALRSRRDRRKRTILFLDECQEAATLLNQDRYRNFFVFIDAICRDHDLGLNVILASRPSFFELPEIRRLNLGRLFNPITLGPLDDSAARAVIEIGDNVLSFQAAAKEHILHLTGRHAYWLQFLCHRLFEEAELIGDQVIAKDRVDEVFRTIVEDPSCKPQFYILYEEVEGNKPAMSVLKTLAAEADEVDGISLDVFRIDNLRGNDVTRALGVLSENQIIQIRNTPKGSTAHFKVEALRRWLRQYNLTL
jgi:hypothetical protein